MRLRLFAEKFQILIHPAKGIQRLNRFGTTQLFIQVCGSTESWVAAISKCVSQPHGIGKLHPVRRVNAEQLFLVGHHLEDSSETSPARGDTPEKNPEKALPSEAFQV